MPKIFLSYRRDDSEFAANDLYKRLGEHYGKSSVFLDVDVIPPGVDFRRHLAKVVAQCDVVLALIGKHWLDTRDDKGDRRLDNLNDFVRIELNVALRLCLPVVPVLLGRSKMPREHELPEDLRPLAYRNAVEVHSGRDFDMHVGRLIKGIDDLFRQNGESAINLAQIKQAPGDITRQHGS